MATYVLVHGAWHTGAELEPTAAPIRAAGHEVHTPTIAGNKPGDPKTVGLSDAIKSIVDYLTEKNLKDVILVGHSYGGMRRRPSWLYPAHPPLDGIRRKYPYA
jgi:pimeloyl-ACP methyl ester carboxylesterase